MSSGDFTTRGNSDERVETIHLAAVDATTTKGRCALVASRVHVCRWSKACLIKGQSTSVIAWLHDPTYVLLRICLHRGMRWFHKSMAIHDHGVHLDCSHAGGRNSITTAGILRRRSSRHHGSIVPCRSLRKAPGALRVRSIP